jgi:ribokinase
MTKFAVVGLGQCAYDILGRVAAYPAADVKAELGEILFQGGGPTATALVTLARLGIATAFFGRVGDDDFGVRIRSGLLAEGVDCVNLFTDAGRTSQFAFIAVEEGSGRRNIFWNRGGARPLSPSEIDPAPIRNCRVLHLDGLQQEASLAAARVAREAGVTTVLDGGTFRDGTSDLLPLIDHLVVSEKFALQAAGGEEPPLALEKLLSHGAQAVTVTVGGRGSHTLSRDGEEFHQPAFSAEVVDTTGCGDVFHGGYIYGLLQRWDLRRTVSFAAACAALKTRALGGRTAIPTLAEVETFLLNASIEKRNPESARG